MFNGSDLRPQDREDFLEETKISGRKGKADGPGRTGRSGVLGAAQTRPDSLADPRNLTCGSWWVGWRVCLGRGLAEMEFAIRKTRGHGCGRLSSNHMGTRPVRDSSAQPKMWGLKSTLVWERGARNPSLRRAGIKLPLL